MQMSPVNKKQRDNHRILIFKHVRFYHIWANIAKGIQKENTLDNLIYEIRYNHLKTAASTPGSSQPHVAEAIILYFTGGLS